MTRRLMAALVSAVALSSAWPASALPEQREAVVPAAFFGMHMNMGAHRADFGWPQVPFGSWRLIHPTTVWSGLEPAPGEWNWNALDRAVADAASHGVEPLLTLGYTPDWAARKPRGAPPAAEGRATYPPRDIDAWRRYVVTVAQRYKGRVRWFELWNEPHFRETDTPDRGFSVDDMVELAGVARAALREVDTANRLVSFSPPGAERGIRRLELFFERGGGAFIDVVGFHFYTTPPAPEAVHGLAMRLRDVMSRHGLAGMPIWNTEAGYLTEDAEHGIPAGPINRQGDRYLRLDEAAAYGARTLLIALDAGIERWYSYGWSIRGWSLSTDRGRVPNAAGRAYATAHRWLYGNRFRGCVRPSPTRWQCRLERRDGAVAEVVWTTSGKAETVHASPARWLESLDGDTRAIVATQPIRVDGVPVLLKQDAAPWKASP